MEANIEKPPVWIDQENELEKLSAHLLREKIVGVDTESDSLYAYHEKVCLIQISTTTNDYLIDTLSITNLTSLAPFFESESVEKVFHAAEYDIICLKRDFNFEIKHVFDTMIASRILGKTQVGLSSLLFEFFDLQINKKYQRANWGKRPLPPEMLSYARIDSHFLIELKSILREELMEKDLIDLAEEDFDRVSQTIPPTGHNYEENCWRVLKGQHINPKQAAILLELCAFREKLAEKADVPPFKILGNKTILNILNHLPETIEELSNIDGLQQKFIDRNGFALLEAIKKGKSNPPYYKKNKNKPGDDFINLYETLKKWRKEKADQLKVESDVVLPKDVIEKIAHKAPKEISSLKIAMSNVPVRFDKFGKEILKIINEKEPE